MSNYRGTNIDQFAEMNPGNSRVKLTNATTGQNYAVLEFVDMAPDLVKDDIIISSNPVRYYKVTDNRICTAVGLISRCCVVPHPAP